MKRFLSILNRLKEDRADLTQVLIIVAGFAVAAVIAITGITQVTQEKGRWTAECINNFNPFETEGELNRSDCSKQEGENEEETIMCYKNEADRQNEVNGWPSLPNGLCLY